MTRAIRLVAEKLDLSMKVKRLWLSSRVLLCSRLCRTVPVWTVLWPTLWLLLEIWTIILAVLWLIVTCILFLGGPLSVMCLLGDLTLRVSVPCSTRLSGVPTCLSRPWLTLFRVFLTCSRVCPLSLLLARCSSWCRNGIIELKGITCACTSFLRSLASMCDRRSSSALDRCARLLRPARSVTRLPIDLDSVCESRRSAEKWLSLSGLNMILLLVLVLCRQCDRTRVLALTLSRCSRLCRCAIARLSLIRPV